MSKGSHILVTGVSGFLGSHVAHRLLADGYRVRGVVRSSKVPTIQQRYTSTPYADKFEAVGLDDLVAGDFTNALQDIDGVIHLAAPLPGRASPKQAIDAAVEGSLNVFRQAEAAGVKNFVYISSILALADFKSRIPLGGMLTDQDWSTLREEDALSPGAHPFVVYAVEKTLGERAVWEFADEHPHVEVTTINPPFFFGPFAPEFSVPDASLDALSSNLMLYGLLRPDGPTPPSPESVDVRDVALALVAALRAPPTSQVGRKRIMLSGEWFSPRDAAEYVAEIRPQVKERLSEKWKRAGPVPKSIIDNSRAKELLGIEATPWKTTIMDAVDDLLKMEEEWKSRGLVAH